MYGKLIPSPVAKELLNIIHQWYWYKYNQPVWFLNDESVKTDSLKEPVLQDKSMIIENLFFSFLETSVVRLIFYSRSINKPYLNLSTYIPEGKLIPAPKRWKELMFHATQTQRLIINCSHVTPVEASCKWRITCPNIWHLLFAPVVTNNVVVPSLLIKNSAESRQFDSYCAKAKMWFKVVMFFLLKCVW